MSRIIPLFSASAIVLAGALLSIRLLTPSFAAGTQTYDHPAIALCLTMIIAGAAWLALLPLLRQMRLPDKSALPAIMVPAIILLGLVLRLLFFGSDPVYENDFKRYLWDGAVTAIGANPYEYSPHDIYEASKLGASSVPDLARLAVFSNDANGITGEINSPVLTTIYPPAAQGVFALAYWIAPFKLWSLKLVFLLFELIGLAVLLVGLRSRGQPIIWSALYWLNPVIIFTTYNGLHMDVLLVAPLLAALLWAGRRPILAAIMLSLAAAIKLWPLLLAPVLFRHWRAKPLVYFGVAALIAVLTLLSLLPMLLSLGDSAGLVAYSANWTNSSFIFPGLRDVLGIFVGVSVSFADRLSLVFYLVFNVPAFCCDALVRARAGLTNCGRRRLFCALSNGRSRALRYLCACSSAVGIWYPASCAYARWIESESPCLSPL